ncbi:MAG TPA: VOC family protein [Nocardioides sp.]|uniref:VOC family protein n=1 Tax=Nocardioides sp. TaxID=35761 RepID=UPI002ED915C8
MRLHHVQVGIPAGGEEAGRRFYADGLGMSEVAKPAELAARGGAWFRSEGGAEIHLGVEEAFAPARKAHPALAVATVDELERLGTRLERAGFAVDWSQRHNAEAFERFHTRDPFGNRVEVVVVVTRE